MAKQDDTRERLQRFEDARILLAAHGILTESESWHAKGAIDRRFADLLVRELLAASKLETP